MYADCEGGAVSALIRAILAAVLLTSCAPPDASPAPVRWVAAVDSPCAVEAWYAAVDAWQEVRGRALREDCQEVGLDFLIGVGMPSTHTPCTTAGDDGYNGCTVYGHRMMWITEGAMETTKWDPKNKLWRVFVHEFLHVAVSCEGEPGNHEHTTPDIWRPDPLSAEQVAQASDNGACAGGVL